MGNGRTMTFGRNSAWLQNPMFLASLALACLASIASGGSKVPPQNNGVSRHQTGAAKMKVQQEIQKLREGNEFAGDVRPFTVPDAEALDQFASELRQSGSIHVRNQIVRILVALAKHGDPNHRIQDRRIISILLDDGSVHPDGAFMQAMAELAEHSTAQALGEYDPTLGRLADKSPVPDLFLVVAKAKATAALPAMRKLQQEERWARDDRFRIALAALGDKSQEEYFTQRFRNTSDAREKTALAEKVSKIGTRSAVQSLAEEMRSSLVVSIPGSFEFSVRVEIAKALGSHYPDKAYLSVVKTEADYERIEKFCEEEFGVKWSSPRPPFLTYNQLAPEH